MKKQTKIQLLPFEIELLSDAGIILTKNAIMQKLKSFLEEIQLKQKAIIEKNISAFPAEVLKTSPKVSRGENYKGLPWLVLDYPRHFEHGNIFAIRTMFWWGNFFSVTLQVSGTYKTAFEQNLANSFNYLLQNNYSICTNDTPWEHNFNHNNYVSLIELTPDKFSAILSSKPFLKLAKKIPITSWENVPAFVVKSFCEMAQLLKTG